MPELSQEQVNEILKGIKIPPQPQIMVDLQMEQAMPEPDSNRIAELISHDVGLAGTLLKIVNSPLYGLANKISSIHQSVNILGMNTVVNIINGISIKNALSDDNIEAMTRFWDTAMDIAMVSSTIAKQVGYAKPDQAYSLGLFHNVGIPILMTKFENYLGYMLGGYSSTMDRIIDFENQQIQCNHAVVGYYTAKSWNLPKQLCDIIAEHHSCKDRFHKEQVVHNDSNTLMAILKVAEHVCGLHIILGQQNEDHEWQMIADEVLEYLHLNEYELEQLQGNLADLGINPSHYAAMSS